MSHAVLYLWIEQNWRRGVVSGVLSNDDDDDDDDDNNENDDDDDDEHGNFTVYNKNDEALIWSWQFLESKLSTIYHKHLPHFSKLNVFT